MSGKSGEEVMVHGGGHPSMTPTYDPDLNLLYLGTGSPRPTFAGEARVGDNLYTSSIVALNAENGAVVWYYQTTPHDTHAWDALATPVLADLEFKGKPRRLLLQANRNGRLFVLDRATGESLLSAPYVTTNWPNEVNGTGQPIPQKDREPRPDGVLAPTGATDSRPASFSPNTNLFYANTDPNRYSIFYRWSGSSAMPRGRAGVERVVSRPDSVLVALDYQTGRTRWTSDAGGVGGVLSTAGGLVITSGANGSVAALDADTGKVLWHSRMGAMANSAITYELGGRQYIITPAGASLFAWALPER
jgi:alcohol dehydrogenase (cytochrome c)